MKVWFDDPRQLVDEKNFLQFWPNGEQSPEERINAASRFIVYASTLLYLIRRDPRVFILGGTLLGTIYVLYKSKMVKDGYVGPMGQDSCQAPTMDNPMGNVLMTDYSQAPNRLEACYYPSVKPQVQRYTSDRIPYDSGRSRTSMPKYLRNAMERQFVTMPVSNIPGGQTEFAEWLYGAKNGPMCRSDPSQCDPNARGVQSESFAGLGGDGDKRSGMFGGGNGRA
jgi:hypothetical protein|tara:strand:+ start:2422 stop:3093 length:672 start_codon:yes stop_codon:yes gene_type:complete